MSALEFCSGIALLAGAAYILSPLWWPPVRDEIELSIREARLFWATVPARWERAISHWRGTEDERRMAVVFLALFLVGGGWTWWVCRNGIPPSNGPSAFEILVMAIGLGTFVAGLCAAANLFAVADWVWQGFWGIRAVVPVGNPINRVGGASPLGEARFPKAKEVDAALAGRNDDFVPPKFRG